MPGPIDVPLHPDSRLEHAQPVKTISIGDLCKLVLEVNTWLCFRYVGSYSTHTFENWHPESR